MSSRKLTLGLVVAAAATASAAPAHAVVIDTDRPKLTATGYDFGDGGWLAGEPTGGGELAFDRDGAEIEPRLTGTLHVNDADGTCSRMRLTYYSNENATLATEYGGTVCVDDDRHHEFGVDLDPYADDDIDSVQVAVQKETASGWSTVESSTFEADTFDDAVKITESGVDFGSGGYAAGVPTGSGEIDWWLDDGVVEPHLDGTLHLDGSSGTCARMNLRYLTSGGAFLTSRAGGTVCAPDNGHHEWTVDLDPYESNKIGKVEVELQTQGSNGSWNTAGARTVSIAE